MGGVSEGNLRIRTALVGLFVAGVCAACTSSAKHVDPYCAKLAAVSHRLTSAEQDLFRNGAGSAAALSRVVGELHGLQTNAPPDIRAALSELGTAFQRAQRALQQPSEHGRTKLAKVARVLSTDGTKVSNYVASKCT